MRCKSPGGAIRVAWRLLVVSALVSGSGCTPTKLLKATLAYSVVTQGVATQLRDAPGLVTELCRERLELEYLMQRLTPGQEVKVLHEWIDQPYATASGLGQITWRQRCAGLSRAEDAFQRGLAALEQYGAALGEFAGHDVAPDADIKTLADAAASDAGSLSEDAKPYHDAIAGLSSGLSKLAAELEGDWKGKKLRDLVPRTNKSVHDTISDLQQFIKVVRTRHLRDVRESLKLVVEGIDQVRRLNAEGLNLPAAASPKEFEPAFKLVLSSIGQTRALNDVALDLLTARIDVDVTRRLDDIDARLTGMSQALESLADAHAKLADGWERGEQDGIATLKSIATLAGDAYHELSAFKNATKGPLQ